MRKPVVLAVFGTRPEVIKLAPVVRALRARADLTTPVCVTAQHREMLDLMLSNFDLSPDYDLNLMRKTQDLGGLSARALPRLQRIRRLVRPDRRDPHGEFLRRHPPGLAIDRGLEVAGGGRHPPAQRSGGRTEQG